MVSQLDDAMLKQIRYLVLTEHRPFSYLDFSSDEGKGQPYAITHGTYRNKIPRLKNLGIVEPEPEYNSGTG
jgi:hypothetical protein